MSTNQKRFERSMNLLKPKNCPQCQYKLTDLPNFMSVCTNPECNVKNVRPRIWGTRLSDILPQRDSGGVIC